MSTTVRIGVSFGDDPGIVTVRVSGRSEAIVGSVAAVDRDDSGAVSRVFLREKIFGVGESVDWEGWMPSGATTTVLTRLGATS